MIGIIVILQSILYTAQATTNNIEEIIAQIKIQYPEKIVPLAKAIEQKIPTSSHTQQQILTQVLKLLQTTTQVQEPYSDQYDKLRQERLSRHNSYRQIPLELNTSLTKTAQERAQYLSDNDIRKWSTHKRPWDKAYYNYEWITQRFADRNVYFTDQVGANFSESVGYGYHVCKTNDCIDKLIWDTQSTRDFFMSEKSWNWPHYRAIIQQGFTQVGIWIATNPKTKRYHIVIHYGTSLQESFTKETK